MQLQLELPMVELNSPSHFIDLVTQALSDTEAENQQLILGVHSYGIQPDYGIKAYEAPEREVVAEIIRSVVERVSANSANASTADLMHQVSRTEDYNPLAVADVLVMLKDLHLIEQPDYVIGSGDRPGLALTEHGKALLKYFSEPGPEQG